MPRASTPEARGRIRAGPVGSLPAQPIAWRLKQDVTLLLLAFTMSGMQEMNPREVARSARLFVLALPLLLFAIDFVLLLVTYLLLASIAPNVLGAVATRPAVFAAWIALVKLPMTFTYIGALSGRAFMTVVTTGQIPDQPVRKGRRRNLVRACNETAGVVATATGALIVFEHVADPGDVKVWKLVAVTAIGPFLLPKSIAALSRLLRWWWRRRPSYQPRHARPEEDHSPDQPNQVSDTPHTAHPADPPSMPRGF